MRSAAARVTGQAKTPFDQSSPQELRQGTQRIQAGVLNQQMSQIVERQLERAGQSADVQTTQTLFSAGPSPSAPTALRRVRPPKWVGWAMLSVGGVLIFHSLAMRRPE